jgi:hypothetical protein
MAWKLEETERTKMLKILKTLRTFQLWLSYKLAESKNVYPYKIVGQSYTDNTTIIIYTILGKRDIYKTPIKELMDDDNLINYFSPKQAAKLGAIALGDILFALPPEQRESRFKNIKERMLEEDSESCITKDKDVKND